MDNVWKGYYFHQYIPHDKGPFDFCRTSWLRLRHSPGETTHESPHHSHIIFSSCFSKHKTSLSKLKNVTNERETRIKELEEKLAHEAKEQSKQLEVIQEEGRITTELTSLGAQCRGERHEQVITRQREALTELRIRIKDLEQLKPPSKC